MERRSAARFELALLMTSELCRNWHCARISFCPGWNYTDKTKRFGADGFKLMLFIGAGEDGVAHLDIMPLLTKQNAPFPMQNNYPMFMRMLVER